MKNLRVFIYGILTFSAYACEIPFELDNVSSPAIYVEFLPSAPYNTLTFNVGYADPAFGKPSGLHPIDIADISVTCNGKAVGISQDCIRNGNMLTAATDLAGLKSGDRIEIRVKSDFAPQAWASTVIPPMPEISSVRMERASGDSASTAKRVTVTLSSDVADGEYFGMRILEKRTIITAITDPTYYAPLTVVRDTSVSYVYRLPGQIASREDLNSLDLDAFANAYYTGGPTEEGKLVTGAMMLMTSRQFDGNAYTFYIDRGGFDPGVLFPDDFDFPDDFEFPEGDDFYPDTDEVPGQYVILDNTDYVVEVYRLSEELYNYCKAQYLMNFNMLSNFGVTPPNFTYSNVRNGLGIMGGISGVRTEWLPDPDNGEEKSFEEQ